MKLIYIAPMLNPVGGLERTLTDKANYLVAKGHEVMFLTYKQGNEKVFYNLDQRVRQCDIDCHLFTIYRLPLYARLKKYFSLRSQFRERMRKVLAEFRPDVIVITIPNTEDFISDMIAVADNVRVVIECHLASAYHNVGKPSTERLLTMLFPPIKAIRKADLLIALTERDANYWRQRHVSNVLVIPNPLTYYNDQLTTIGKKDNRIIAVGRLFEQKRFDRLIEAFSIIATKYPTWKLNIFGEGPLWDKLQSQIRQLGLTERISIDKPTKEILLEYMRSRFFVLSSDFEGFGLVIIEAMSCGIPVVSTDCPCGPSEIIQDGETGLLSKLDSKDLADKMEWMITHDEELTTFGTNAHKAAARYRQEIIMPEWEHAYINDIHWNNKS